MKTLARLASRSLSRPLLSALFLGLLTTAARADQVDELEVDVRSAIVDKPAGLKKSETPEAGTHGKVYGILAVQLIPTQDKMIKPVDAAKLLELVHHELQTHGFQPAPKGRKPEILLTVQYGRAYLNNPYFGDTQEVEYQAGNLPERHLGITDLTQSMKMKVAGMEAKTQKAEFEKLCIRVTAWAYPTDPKSHAKRLWNTIMIVDDPDHRDLNAVAAEMLAAGAAYFDRQIDDPEVEVYKPLPEGHVKVGTPEVVGSAPPKEK